MYIKSDFKDDVFHYILRVLIFLPSIFSSIDAFAEYKLPFPKDKSYLISQCGSGYPDANPYNHTDDMAYAWDFAMQIGSEVSAISDGEVVHVTNNFNQGRCNESLINSANRVVIKHDDESFSLYLHLLKDKIFVKKGDNVKRGQVIALSGASGYVCSKTGGNGAHLHFQLEKKPNTYWASSKEIHFYEIEDCRIGVRVTSDNSKPSGCADYKDVSSTNKYCKSIKYAKDHKIMNGYGDGYFYSNDKLINRAEFIKVVLSARNIPLQSLPTKCFSDLESSTTWYTPYVCTAKQREIIKGDGGGVTDTFRPEAHINYVEALKIALKAYGYTEPEVGTNWYDTYIEKAKQEGIDRLKPSEKVGRDFAAHLLCQINEKILEKNDGGKCSE